MDKFTKAELEGRTVWNTTLSGRIEDIKFTESKYDPVDGYLTGQTGTEVVFELKKRYNNSKDYEKEGYIIEKVKYDALMDSYKKTNHIPYYVNIFQDCIKMWDIRELKPSFETKYCTATTAENYKKGGKPKLVHLIKTEPTSTIWINNTLYR